MLTDIRCRNQNLRKGDRVVREEEQAEEILGVRVNVDDTSDINDQANGLWSEHW